MNLMPRLYFFIAATYLAIIIIFLKIFYLQIPLRELLFLKSQKNFTRFESVFPVRSNIIDCNGALLATNKPIVKIYWQGTGNSSLSKDQLVLLDYLKKIGNLSIDAAFMKHLTRVERHKTGMLLISDLDKYLLITLLEQFSGNKNIKVEHDFKRYYPYKNAACHVLGYLNKMDQHYVGKMGLEGLFQDQLNGQRGQNRFVINSVGTPLHQEEMRKALIGNDVKTTINVSLQLLAEELVPQECTGAFLLMDPKNGAIRALVSRPNFDPAVFINPLDHEHWKGLQTGYPFVNRAFKACYPPASIFKLVTMSAALENNIIMPDDKTMCRGYTRFGARRYHCANRFGHGVLTTKEALAHSCNIIFFDIGKKISIDLLADYATRFGLGQKTGVIFDEKVGLVPTSAWKRQVKGEPWWPGETLSCAIGQSYLSITPIQIARMIGAIFEGYLVRPRLLEQEPLNYQPLMVKQSTRTFLQESMKLAVDEGTGKLVSLVKDVHIWAKTGTAETSSNKQTAPHAWFVAYFYYKENPLVMVIVIEHTDALKIAVRIAKNYLNRYKKYQDE